MKALSTLAARSALLWAAFVVVLALIWQASTVSYNYAGNWTALFRTGAEFKAPPAALASEDIFRFKDTGYDGQIYHYIAHDPFLTRGFSSSIDSPRFRYRRILVPFTAWLLAAGQDRFIDTAYIAVVLAFLFLGTFWSGSLLRIYGLHPAYSLAFLAMPAVLVSLDRMTIDIAVTAFAVGAVLYAVRGSWATVWVICALAGLTRDVGLLIPVALAGYSLLQGRVWRVAVLASSALPTMAWYLYVHSLTVPVERSYVSLIPLQGWFTRVLNPYPYSFTPLVNGLATVLDYAALAGILAAVVYVVSHSRRLLLSAVGCMALTFALLPVFINEADVWTEAFSFARVFSPLLLMVAVDGAETRRVVALVPLLLIVPRILMQFGPQITGLTRGLLGLS
jgi:hypothetical protein